MIWIFFREFLRGNALLLLILYIYIYIYIYKYIYIYIYKIYRNAFMSFPTCTIKVIFLLLTFVECIYKLI